MKTNNSDHRDLSEEQRALVKKTEEILGAGGLSAEALSTLIVGFHRRLREELHPAGSPAETGAGDKGESSPTDVPRLAHLTINQADRFRDALDHLEIIYDLLVESHTFSGLSSLLLYPKEIFEGLNQEFDAAHQAIQAEKAEREQATVC